MINVTSSLCIAIIVFCQAVFYFETRRHAQKKNAQQFSVAARQKFLKDKRALKLTTNAIALLEVEQRRKSKQVNQVAHEPFKVNKTESRTFMTLLDFTFHKNNFFGVLLSNDREN